MLEILAQQEAAFLVGRHRNDQCVPDWHLVIGGQVECPVHRVEGRVSDNECIGPAQYRRLCLGRRETGFADEHAVQFPQHLSRKHNELRREARNELSCGRATRRISNALRVREHVGVECDA